MNLRNRFLRSLSCPLLTLSLIVALCHIATFGNSAASAQSASSTGSLADPMSSTAKDLFSLPESEDRIGPPPGLLPPKNPNTLTNSEPSKAIPQTTEGLPTPSFSLDDTEPVISKELTPILTPAITPPPLPRDTSLRDASISEKERLDKQRIPESELDRTMPIHADPQVTRWLVQAAMLEKESARQRNNEILNKQLKLYEQIITRTCAPAFGRTLTVPSPLPQDPACINTLQKIKVIHPTHPTAACLEHGIQSEECALYTGMQRVASSPINERESALYRLSVGTAEAGAVARYKQLADKMYSLSKTPLLQITPADVEAIRTFLSVTCMDYSVGTEEIPAESSKTTDPAKRALLEQIESMTGSKISTETPQDAPLRLVRILPDPCTETLTMVKKLPLQMAATACYEQGPLAPACIQALRDERNNRYALPRSPATSGSSSRSGKSAGQDGLQGF